MRSNASIVAVLVGVACAIGSGEQFIATISPGFVDVGDDLVAVGPEGLRSISGGIWKKMLRTMV